jgi:uncharacterized membrane protein
VGDDAAEKFAGGVALTVGSPHTNGSVRLPTSTAGTTTRKASVPREPVMPSDAMTATAPDRRAYRLTSIDMLRGLVIVIMALDHVRDFVMTGSVQEPLSNPDVAPALFMTRWITHICAPVFVFLAGTSAGLMTARKSPASLGGFLAKRGSWLILVEWTLLSTAITFSPLGLPQFGGRILIVFQVLWAIGASMLALAGAQFLGRRACLIGGAAIVLGHNLLDSVWPATHLPDNAPLWVALHAQMTYVVGPFQLINIYPLLPWIGVMLLGFGSAGMFEQAPEKRRADLLRIGLMLTAAFIVIRALNRYGDPHSWQVQAAGFGATLMSFINTSKYPPSLLFLLMTLGPAAIICAYADSFKGWVKDTLVMYGRVPFAFYVAHFYLAHALGVVIGVWQGYTVSQMATVPFFNPKGFGLGLPGVYAVWLLVIVLLYPPCRWVAALKARRTDWWLSYL